MNYQSPAWQAALPRPRERKWELPYGADEPLMPWIAPPLPENLKKLFLSIGAEYEAQPGQLIYRVNNDLNSMTLITHGIAGRSLFPEELQEAITHFSHVDLETAAILQSLR